MDILRQTHNLEIYRGDNVYMELEIVDSDEEAVDITGCTLTSQIRRDFDNEDILLRLHPTIIDATTGLIEVVSVDDTSDLDFGPGDGVWDLQLVTDEATPLVLTAFAGTVSYAKDVTKDD